MMASMEDAPFEQRKEEFLRRYKMLIDDLHCDFMTTPCATPNPEFGTWLIGEITLRTEVMDTKGIPMRSPIQFHA